MNKDNAKEFLPLVQALADGKTIQYRQRPQDSWISLRDASFTLDRSFYRIKPEPVKLTAWAVVYEISGNLLEIYQSQALAFLCAGNGPGRVVVPMNGEFVPVNNYEG